MPQKLPLEIIYFKLGSIIVKIKYLKIKLTKRIMKITKYFRINGKGNTTCKNLGISIKLIFVEVGGVGFAAISIHVKK